MAKRFLFVSGDIGGTNMMVPVAKKLISEGHQVDFVVDGDGMAYGQLLKNRLEFRAQFAENLSHLDDDADLVFISTCASANGVPKSYAKACFNVRPTVFGADGLFNHAYKWRKEKADYWFAVNQAHAGAIRALRPDLSPSQVIVTGQPAFDSALGLCLKKDEIRKSCRSELGIRDDETLFLWWSQGMPEVIEEDVDMVLAGIETIKEVVQNGVFIPRVHPKLELVKPGYVQEIHEKIESACHQNGIRLVRADQVPAESICLASEMIISVTCTEDIKNWLMGGPPVIHPMGIQIRRWFQESLLLKPPFYLPDVENHEALSVMNNGQWSYNIYLALDSRVRQNIRRNWQPPTELATNKVADRLIELAEK